MSQRELAKLVGVEYHTFISQIEQGRGRIPPDRYLLWAGILGVESHEFVLGLMSCYDPVTYNVIFEREPGIDVSATSAKDSSAIVDDRQGAEAVSCRQGVRTGSRRTKRSFDS